MSEQFIDFFMTITPTILTSVTGFLLGKYNHFQNRPLDKMEIAYDRLATLEFFHKDSYVYMFYMSDVKKETLMSRIDNKTNELLRGLSDELNSIFDGVEMNDMKCWGTAS